MKKPGIPVWVWGVVGLLILVVAFDLFSNITGASALKVEIPVVSQPTVSTKISTLAPTQSPTSTPVPILGIGSTKVSEKDGMILQYVPAGEFTMGSNSGFNDDEKPMHKVNLNSFWIDQTEVANIQYRKCVLAGVCNDRSAGDTQTTPIFWVTWNDAQTYCNWAGRRLPTEAEWEKAARGTDGRVYPWGSGLDCTLANYSMENGCEWHAMPVGSYPRGASPYGVLDMAGNVSEWVADWYSESYISESPYKNPPGPSSGVDKVVRGGSFWSTFRFINTFRRMKSNDAGGIGIRCAMDAAE